ncbi:CHAD domain-containing protein [Nocardia cyriacigeorgica]|uniref:CHAD domain-containing protein n=1 Tax=Nocardia cyriacigeorgica TaxID=135487 RepID=UPI0018954ACE|nr:CHAD domain-containing protein [Nocardia cyriacigeorgica]MBF6455606.1 CHAD domain-containing protein [Nocardia cyriacigeorgica]MBF6477526.1 CHAD domain-containing protein [Nocardia cyriacigeorgica]MBF6553652.1 CHAD domain-containing protein [Nocardia cyriacigeorgica]
MTATAADALIAALGEDIDRLLAAEPEVRADAWDSVHQMRVATRRLRSVLRSYRRLFKRRPAAAMVAELAWLAGLLGVARDAEVRAERFAALLDSELTEGADPDVLGAVTHRLVAAERERYSAAHTEVLGALDSARYRALRDQLASWRTAPPLRKARVSGPADDAFRSVLHRDRARLQRMVGAEVTVAPADRIELLHDIRKGAKRLRYSCEAAADTLGGEADELGSQAKRLQTVLGDHRDAVESRAAILARAAEARAAGESTALYSALADAEDRAAGEHLAKYPVTAASLLPG